MLNQIQSRIEKLSEEELLNLARSYDFRYVIRETGGKQIYEGSGLKIYDLANFWKSRFESRFGKEFTVPANRSEGVEMFTDCRKL